MLEAIYCGATPLLPRRLSYPELLPAGLHDELLYDNYDDLLRKLRRALSEPQLVRAQNLAWVADRFRWEKIAPIYDAGFEAPGQSGG